MTPPKFHFANMRDATDSLTVGSPEWLEGMSVRLQYTFEKVEEYGIEKLIAVLRDLLKYEPWDSVPKDRPCKRADVYYEGVTGKPWRVLVALVREYDESLATEIQAHVNSGGKDNQYTVPVDNVNRQPDGNSEAYTLNRLRRAAPELFEKVKQGGISANAAAIQAGFRRPTKTIPIETPASAVRALLRVFSAEELIDAITSATDQRQEA